MELRHLVHAKSLADEGSFRVAAAKLGLTQPALTKSIQALEAEVGVRLFDCSRKGIAPTAAGAALLRRAAGLLDGMADLQAELRAIRSEEHTSELQSLMRISYAVFCLKKKKKKSMNQEH